MTIYSMVTGKSFVEITSEFSGRVMEILRLQLVAVAEHLRPMQEEFTRIRQINNI